MRIYVGGSFADKGRLREIAERLARSPKVTITSTWLWADGDRNWDELSIEDKRRRAISDFNDIKASDLLIFDTTRPSTGGGREVEAGFAMGRSITVWRVGPAPSGFHELASRAFADWDQVERRLNPREEAA